MVEGGIVQEERKKQPDDAGRGSFDGEKLKVWEGARHRSQACRLQLFAGCAEGGRVHRNSPEPRGAEARRSRGGAEEARTANSCPGRRDKACVGLGWGRMEWRRERASAQVARRCSVGSCYSPWVMMLLLLLRLCATTTTNSSESGGVLVRLFSVGEGEGRDLFLPLDLRPQCRGRTDQLIRID